MAGPAPAPPPPPPRYALELSGGVRTFTMCWLLLQRHLIAPNGGLAAFDVSIVANFSPSQRHLASDARDIAAASRFAHVDIHASDRDRTCRFWGYEPSVCPEWQVPRGHQRFPYQHEAVRLAHEGLPRSNSTGKEAYALVIRTRPDVLLFKTLSLATVEAQLRSEAKSALLCDLPSAATGRLVSPWDLCNKIALRDLCRRE